MNINDKSEVTFYYMANQYLPGTISDSNYLGTYASVSDLPTSGVGDFSLAGIAGTSSMYSYVNGSWTYLGEYLHDAYRYLVYYEGSAFASASGTKWTSVFNDIASNSSLMTEFASNQTAMTNLTASSVAMNSISAFSNAMNAVIGSSTALNIVVGSSTAMNAVAGSSIAMNAVAGSSTAMNAVIGSSTALNIVVGSSTAMSAVANSSTAMSAVAGSSTAMNAIVSSYTAINAMTTLTAYTALQASTLSPSVTTLISNINSGTMILGSTATGSATTIGLNGLLVLLATDNGAAVTSGNSTESYSSNTLAQKIDSAFGSLEIESSDPNGDSVTVVTVGTNQIVFVVKGTAPDPNVDWSVTSSVNGNIIWYNTQGTIYPNESASPLQLSGATVTQAPSQTGSMPLYTYYVTYTPS